MKHARDGTKTLYYDTYALFALALGQESYKHFATNVNVVTCLMNLYELYYILLQENHQPEAEHFLERFLPYCAAIEPNDIRQAAHFRLQHTKLKLSYIDVLGYILARKHHVPFLTGDAGFRKLANVVFRQ